MFKKIDYFLYLLLLQCVSISAMEGLLIKGTKVVATQALTHAVLPIEPSGVSLGASQVAEQSAITVSQSNPTLYCLVVNASQNQSVRPFANQSLLNTVAKRKYEESRQADEYKLQSIARIQNEMIVDTLIALERSQLVADIEKLLTGNQGGTFQLMKDYAEYSKYALEEKQGNLRCYLHQLERQLQNLMAKNDRVEFFINAEQNCLEYESIRCDIKKAMSNQDLCDLKQALEFQNQIKSVKRDIQTIVDTLSKDERDFKNQFENKSSDQISQEIMTKLEQEKQINDKKISQTQNELSDLDKKIKINKNQLKEYQQQFFLKKIGTGRYRKNLEEEQKDLVDAYKTNKKDLTSLSAEADEISKKIEYTQTVLKEKIAQEKLDQEAQLERERQEALRLQEKQAQEEQLLQQAHDLQLVTEQENAEFLQKQQEIELGYKEQLKNQYCSLDFDSPGCPDSVWCERQDALFRTEQSDYAAYDQEYVLSPQAQAFLKLHHIDDTQIQNFSGTALQQQLHVEYCNIIEQAASKQAELFYQSDLLKQCVLCADAAYDANQLGQIQMVLSLNNLGFTLLEYGQAIDTGVALAGKGFLHTLAHPQESIKSIGRAVYFVLETAALNCYSEEYGFEDLYIPLRDQRNAAIAAGLKTLGKKIANSTGPQRVQAFMQCAVEFAIPGTIASVAGGVMGIAESAVVKAANAVQAETNIAKTVQAVATIVGKSQEAQEVVADVVKVARQAEVAVQESIAQNVAENLLNVEKQLDKVVKSGVGCGSEAVNQFKQTLADLLKNTIPGKVTKGDTKQYEKFLGDYAEAIQDFYNLKPSYVQKMVNKEGLHGILPDGRRINVRLESTAKVPTIEIQPAKGVTSWTIKIRYGNKNL